MGWWDSRKTSRPSWPYSLDPVAFTAPDSSIQTEWFTELPKIWEPTKAQTNKSTGKLRAKWESLWKREIKKRNGLRFKKIDHQLTAPIFPILHKEPSDLVNAEWKPGEAVTCGYSRSIEFISLPTIEGLGSKIGRLTIRIDESEVRGGKPATAHRKGFSRTQANGQENDCKRKKEFNFYKHLKQLFTSLCSWPREHPQTVFKVCKNILTC